MSATDSLLQDGPNKWLNGVKARAEDTGDGFVRLPLSDWQSVVYCFEWGEVLFADARDALVRIALGIEGRRVSGYKPDEIDSVGQPKPDWRLAEKALVTTGAVRNDD